MLPTANRKNKKHRIANVSVHPFGSRRAPGNLGRVSTPLKYIALELLWGMTGSFFGGVFWGRAKARKERFLGIHPTIPSPRIRAFIEEGSAAFYENGITWGRRIPT